MRRSNGPFELSVEVVVRPRSEPEAVIEVGLAAVVQNEVIMRALSADYDQLKHRIDLFTVGPIDLAAREHAVTPEMLRPWPVSTMQDADHVLARMIYMCDRWLLPFIEETSSSEGVRRMFEKGLCPYMNGDQARAFLNILDGKGEKWIWHATHEENLRRANVAQ